MPHCTTLRRVSLAQVLWLSPSLASLTRPSRLRPSVAGLPVAGLSGHTARARTNIVETSLTGQLNDPLLSVTER